MTVHSLPRVEAKQHHDEHGVPKHSIGMIENQTTLDWIINNLTVIDQQLYKSAYAQFQEEIQIVWKETGFDLLCRGDTMQRQQGGKLEPRNDTKMAAHKEVVDSSEEVRFPRLASKLNSFIIVFFFGVFLAYLCRSRIQRRPLGVKGGQGEYEMIASSES